ncbi:FAD-dependent oxidoreductase [Actinoplanes sp. NPDC051494]|uniref:FAD-dependent oxidoreductase n=1 Tax=Actinoplanes sp. NPDC051494 TaxID=3363907 RepID=UPI0037A85C87
MRVCVVGAGQAGLQFALGLLAEGFEVTVVSARTPGELRQGPPLSTQAMFHDALETERAYGLNLWTPRRSRSRACGSRCPRRRGSGRRRSARA